MIKYEKKERRPRNGKDVKNEKGRMNMHTRSRSSHFFNSLHRKRLEKAECIMCQSKRYSRKIQKQECSKAKNSGYTYRESDL